MADFTVSTNMITLLTSAAGMFGWPNDTDDAARIASMQPDDLIVPKFAQNPDFKHAGNTSQEQYQRGIAQVMGVDFDEQLARYHALIDWGKGATPFVMRVADVPYQRNDIQGSPPWACVPIELLYLEHPLSTSEYLRLRVIPVELGVQFKANVAPNRHVQTLAAGAGAQVLAAGRVTERWPEFLRSETLVWAETAEQAVEQLTAAGLPPRRLDRAFLVGSEAMAGLHVCKADGQLSSAGEPIPMPPSDLGALFQIAAGANVGFPAMNPRHAAQQLASFMASPNEVLVTEEFSHFHDRYVLLPRKVNEALEIRAAHPEPPFPPDPPLPPDIDPLDDENVDPDVEKIDLVEGLSLSAVRAALLDHMAIDDEVLAEAVTALRAGKHLILSGPPGTGKSTLAFAISKAAGASFKTATATADWSTVDTIGAYLPAPSGGGLVFEEGVVLTALAAGSWLVIDELNRADIDKAFGPLFTLLAGSGGASAQPVTLPFQRDGQRIEIGWAPTLAQKQTAYAVTRAWRLIGTMNDSDKSSLFGLSFAFLRRFAVIDVGLPSHDAYAQLIRKRLTPEHATTQLVAAAMAIAHGPIRLGPAILLDIAEFTRRGMTETTDGVLYPDALDAFLTATRLYAVPQYEGAEDTQIAAFKAALQSVIPTPPAGPWTRLTSALDAVGISAP